MAETVVCCECSVLSIVGETVNTHADGWVVGLVDETVVRCECSVLSFGG